VIYCNDVDFNVNMVRLHRLFTEGVAKPANAQTWQGVDITDRPEMVAHELEDVCLEIPIYKTEKNLRQIVQPNMPWAEDHFQERISGIPHNPPPSDVHWPYAQSGNAEFKKKGKFSHTYPERFWPKMARTEWHKDGQGVMDEYPMRGIRYAYGDLMDVIKLLYKDPYTRQAYLPVWFPEDTGVVHGERVPCTLGYHFRYRRDSLDVVYYIRSCDFRRHMRDDVYLACRLGQYISQALVDATLVCRPGKLVMHISGLHVFAGDLPLMRAEHRDRLASAF
jgi:hypothetical protein